jgi:hypothetical protein
MNKRTYRPPVGCRTAIEADRAAQTFTGEEVRRDPPTHPNYRLITSALKEAADAGLI